jgi:uncharacterized protein VirK/YbjX
MANRYDALTVSKYVDRNGDEKSFFTKIGTMFQSKNGDTYSLELIALPIPDKEGKVRLFLKQPEQREGAQQVSRSTSRPAVRPQAPEDDVNDSIPF